MGKMMRREGGGERSGGREAGGRAEERRIKMEGQALWCSDSRGQFTYINVIYNLAYLHLVLQ